VRALDPGSPITVGYTTAFEAEPTVACVDVISFHDYSSTRARQEANFARADELGRKYAKPVIQTETGPDPVSRQFRDDAVYAGDFVVFRYAYLFEPDRSA
jgi:hypothetical protein